MGDWYVRVVGHQHETVMNTAQGNLSGGEPSPGDDFGSFPAPVSKTQFLKQGVEAKIVKLSSSVCRFSIDTESERG